MPRRQSDEVLSTFCDVAACFSADEWKLLHEWQKELYNNVMKEIHRALTSLGPLIATSVFSLRPKKKENLGCVNFQELEIKASINPLPTGNTTPETEVWFEGDQLLMDTQDTDGGGRSDGPRKESAEIPPVASPCIKREEGLYHSEQMDSERKENTVSATAGFPPFNNTEVDAVLKEYKYTDRGGSSICLNLEPEVTTPASSIGINEEGETYAINLQDYPRSHTGYGGTTRPGNIGKCAKYKNKPRPSKTTANKGQEILIQSSQMWSESDWEISGEKTEQWQSGCNQLANSKLHQVTTNVQNVQMSDAYNRSANAVKNYNMVSSKSSPPQGSRSYTSFESEQPCPPNSPSRHLGACEVKSRFSCSDCGKCFPGMSNLITHQRIHTGERPFHCDVCAKSFNQKGALQRHQILHTGEKPYQCNICGKKFNVKHNLVGHQRIHTRVQKSLTNGRSETV